MSDSVVPSLTLVGDSSAPICDGDICTIPGADVATGAAEIEAV